MMSSAVAFHTKGLGSPFQCCVQAVIALVKSATLVPRDRPDSCRSG